MINEKCIKWYLAFNKLAYLSGFTPIDNEKNLHLSVPKSRASRKFLISLIFITSHLYELFIAAMITSEIFFKSRSNLNETILAFAYFMVVLLSIIMQYNMFLHSENIACHVNSFIYFWRHFKDSYVICDRNEISCLINQTQKLSLLMIIFSPILLGTYALENPNDKMFITGYVSDPLIFRILQVLIIPYHIYYCFGSAAMMMFAFYVGLIPGAFAYTLGKEILPRRHGSKDYCTTSELRKPNSIIHLYKTFFILGIFSNEFLSPIILPMQAAVSCAVIICNFGLVHLHQYLNTKAKCIALVISVGFTTLWFVSLWFAGVSYKISIRKIAKLKSLIDWPNCKNEGEKRYYRKALTGLAPFRLKVGNFYVVEVQKAINFISFIFWGTAKVLIMWG